MAFDPVAYINTPRWLESRLGLSRIRALLDRMGRPQDTLRFVHVAGTNGKGSVCAYIASILQETGYRTGLFTSPYLERFEERIRVNGEEISHSDLIEVTLFVKDHADRLEKDLGEHPTEFELMTAVAFEYFSCSNCDIVVTEVGLGGRLDSTNVIENPEVCVITRIGFDHTDILGNTLGAIAAEKAGIIKDGSFVVSWPQKPEAMEAIEAAALIHKASLVISDFSSLSVDPLRGKTTRTFSFCGCSYKTSLLASYQPFNAALALDTISVLREKGWDINDAAIYRGIEKTRWPGRFEIISQEPLVIVDGGHNPQGASALADSLREVTGGEPVHFIMGVLKDKDYRAMVEAVLPYAASFTTYTPHNPRALPADELKNAIEELASLAGRTLVVEAASSPYEAVMVTREKATHAVVAFGSLYGVAEAKEALSCSGVSFAS